MPKPNIKKSKCGNDFRQKYLSGKVGNPIARLCRALRDFSDKGLWVVLGLFLAGVLRAESLREAAALFPGLHVGAAIKSSTLTGGTAAYANTVRYELNAASPENDTKWATLRPTQATFAWTNADAIATFNRAAGQQMRGHTFQWYKSSSLPTWLTGGGFTATQLQAIQYDHINQVGAHYRGDCFVWDVVNEAFNDNGTLRTNNIWYDAPGIGYAGLGTRYIEETFIRAAAADPNALLFYNDYGAEADNSKSDAIYAMAQDFLNRGVPLHGIGYQMHISDIDYNSLRSNFKRFNDLGLDLHITEMDVRVPVDANGDATPASLESQAEIYWNVLGVALGQPRFMGFQTWGLYDGDSWIPTFYPGYGAALLFNKYYQRKPAYWAVWNAMANQAEKFPVLDVSVGDSTNVFSQEALSAGAGRQLVADAAGDFMKLSLAVPKAGEWNMRLGYRISGQSGQFQLAVAPEGSNTFTNVGGVVDAYGGGVGADMTDLGSYVFPTAGNWQVRFTVMGKNANATSYNLTIDYLRITPVVSATNTSPTITNVTDKTTNQNVTAGPFSFTIGDSQTAASVLTVQAVSLNSVLLPAANIALGGSGTSRTVTMTPAANKFGSAAVLLLVSDGVNTTPETFILNVTEVDNNPNWTRTTPGTQSWSIATNWVPVSVPVSGSESQIRILDGITLSSGTVTVNNNLAGTFTLSALTLGGTGASGTASVAALTGSPLSLAIQPSTSAPPEIKLKASKSSVANSSLAYSVAQNITLANTTTVTGNGNADFAFSGILSGGGGLTMSSSGLLKLTGNNSYIGVTTVTAGTLQIGNNTATGSLGSGSVINGATLRFHRSDTGYVIANPIAGPGQLEFGSSSGPADAIAELTGANTFTGGVMVNSGGLRIRSSGGLGSGAKQIYLTGINNYKSRLILNGSTGDISLPASISFKTSNNDATQSAILNEAGNNSIAGDFTLTSGGGITTVNVQAGSLTLSGTFKPDTTTRSLDLTGAGNGFFSGALQNNIDFVPALNKSGSGTWTLTGSAHDFTGATTVSGGMLLVQSPGALPAGSAVTVNSGCSLGGNGAINGTVNLLSGGSLVPGGANMVGTLALADSSAAALTLNGNSLPFDVLTVASSDRIIIAGNLVLNGVNTIALSLPVGTTPPGTYTLMTYAAKTGAGSLALSASYPNTSLTVGATSVTLTVVTSLVTWKGNLSGIWNTDTANWVKNSTASTYATGDAVMFDDTAIGNFTISGNTSPASVTVNNSANNYVLLGNIGGSGTPVIKSGTGLLTLSGANTYGGTTTLNAGTLDAGLISKGALGSGGLFFAGGVLQGRGILTRSLSANSTPDSGQTSGATGGFAAKGGLLTIDLGPSLSLNTGSFRFGTNFIFGSAAADSPVVVVSNIDFGGANRNVTVNSGTGGDSAEFSGVVSDGNASAYGFVKSGTGLLILSGDNTNTGVTTINAGSVRAAHNNAFGTGTVLLGDTEAILELANGITINRGLTVSNTGNKKMVKLQSTSSTGEYAGTILISESAVGNFELSAAVNQVLTVSGKISGTAGGAVSKSGAGSLILSGANDYTTPTLINSGTLIATTLANAGLPSSIGAASDVSGNLVINGGSLRHDAATTAATNRKFAVGLSGATIDSSAVASTHAVNFSTNLAMGFNSQLGPRTLTLAGSNSGENILNLDLNDDGSGNPTSLVKNGTGKWLITGAGNDYTGNTSVTGGTLVLADNAGLKFLVTDASANRITGGGTAVFNGDFTINTSGVTVPSGSWNLVNTATLAATFGSTFTVVGWTKIANLWTLSSGARTWNFSEATGVLNLSVTGAMTYDSWINTFTNISAADRDPGDDPDHDGSSNLIEFALNGNPDDFFDTGKIASLIQNSSSPATNELTLILAVRDSAVFNAGSATVSGITYSVEGSLDLTFPSAAVSSSGPSDTAPAATGLPSLAGSEWEYHTFKLDASEGLTGKGFLRLKVTQP